MVLNIIRNTIDDEHDTTATAMFRLGDVSVATTMSACSFVAHRRQTTQYALWTSRRAMCLNRHKHTQTSSGTCSSAHMYNVQCPNGFRSSRRRWRADDGHFDVCCRVGCLLHLCACMDAYVIHIVFDCDCSGWWNNVSVCVLCCLRPHNSPVLIARCISRKY